MRCEDLTRELSSPTGSLSPAAIAGHLEVCPACAERSRQADRFDRIWEATRPPEPTSAMIDAFWLSASVALEARSAPATTLRLSPRRNWIKPGLVLAQAAAILIAAGLFLSRKVTPPDADHLVKIPVAPLNQVASTLPSNEPRTDEIPRFDVSVDETLVVSIPLNQTEELEVKRLKHLWPEQSNLIPPIMPHDVIGAAEAMTGTWVFTSR